MNVKQYIDEGYTILADKSIARLIKTDFPEVRGRVHVIGDIYAFAGITADKVLIVSDDDLTKAIESIRATLWEAEEVAYIKRTRKSVPKLDPAYIEEEKVSEEKEIHKLDNVDEGDWVVINGEYYAQINGKLKPMQEVVDVVMMVFKDLSNSLSKAFKNLSDSI